MVTLDPITIHWKQDSFFGFGGDRYQTYEVCKYQDISTQEIIPVYIQNGWEIPQFLTIDSRLQCGLNHGIMFLVLHDKEQKPYQNRFFGKSDHPENMQTKNFVGYDASWLVGEYLHNC